MNKEKNREICTCRDGVNWVYTAKKKKKKKNKIRKKKNTTITTTKYRLRIDEHDLAETSGGM